MPDQLCHAELAADEVSELGLGVGCETNDLVLPGIDFEAGIVSEGRVQESERMRPVELLDDLYIATATTSEGRCRPFSHTVDGKDGRLFERRGEEGARGVRFVMLGI